MKLATAAKEAQGITVVGALLALPGVWVSGDIAAYLLNIVVCFVFGTMSWLPFAKVGNDPLRRFVLVPLIYAVLQVGYALIYVFASGLAQQAGYLPRFTPFLPISFTIQFVQACLGSLLSPYLARRIGASARGMN